MTGLHVCEMFCQYTLIVIFHVAYSDTNKHVVTNVVNFVTVKYALMLMFEGRRMKEHKVKLLAHVCSQYI